MSAPEAITWTILDGLRQHLTTIRKANGYRTDLGATVQTELWDGSGDPRIVIVAGEMPILQTGRSRRRRQMPIIIQLELPAAANNAQKTAHAMIADVLDAIPEQQVDIPTPAGACGVVLGAQRILQRPEGAPAVIAVVDATVSFDSKHEKPTPP